MLIQKSVQPKNKKALVSRSRSVNTSSFPWLVHHMGSKNSADGISIKSINTPATTITTWEAVIKPIHTCAFLCFKQTIIRSHKNTKRMKCMSDHDKLLSYSVSNSDLICTLDRHEFVQITYKFDQNSRIVKKRKHCDKLPQHHLDQLTGRRMFKTGLSLNKWCVIIRPIQRQGTLRWPPWGCELYRRYKHVEFTLIVPSL